MKRGDILENIEVEKLVFWGKWFVRLEADEETWKRWRVLFITGWAIPWSIVNLRVTKKKKDFAECQITDIIKKSPIEKKHPNNPYGECGGCKWINIPYTEQLKIKQNQVEEAFFHLKKYQENIDFQEIVPSPLIDWYRNKVEFSFGKYISHKDDITQHFNVWFHKQWEFSKIQDFDGCVLIDEIQNKIYKEIKDFTKTLWLPVYDQKTQQGFFRHIMIRRTFFSDEIMILLWFNPNYSFEWNLKEKINQLNNFFQELAKKYSQIKSVYFSHNTNKADICIWDLECIYGKKTIDETLLGLTFEISPQSFFQTNSHWAEKLYSKVLELATGQTQGTAPTKNSRGEPCIHPDNFWTVLDLYGWTGTIWMIFANNWASKVHSVELMTSSSKDWEKNAEKNWITNMTFVNKKVEDFLWWFLESWEKADLLIIDPPRAGMHPKALPNILKFKTKQIIYVSCNPATLSRDLDFILQNSDYTIETVVPVDMFPHTHHIETIVSLKRK